MRRQTARATRYIPPACNEHTAVIVYGSNMNEQDERNALAAGATLCIHKSQDLEAKLSIIAQYDPIR